MKQHAMSYGDLAYCIVQFSPRPERFEFVNVGVLVFDKLHGRASSKLTDDFSRVKKIFGDASSSFLKMALSDFAERVEYEFIRQGLSISSEEFNSKRAGVFQITPVLPVSGKSASEAASDLFDDLVQSKIKSSRGQRVSTRLTSALEKAGVLSLLQPRPMAVRIEKWKVSVKADYGFQNGVFNLIDSARFEDSERVLEEAGKRILEGRALAETLVHRLVVVGEFIGQSEAVIDSLKDEFLKAKSRLFTLDEVPILADEIRRTAH